MSFVKSVLMGMLMAGIITSVLFSVSFNMNTEYNVASDGKYNATLYKYQGVKDKIDSLGDNTPGSANYKLGESQGFFIFTSTLQAASTLWTTSEIVRTTLVATDEDGNNLATNLQIDPIWTSAAFLWITLGLILTLIGAIVINRV